MVHLEEEGAAEQDTMAEEVEQVPDPRTSQDPEAAGEAQQY